MLGGEEPLAAAHATLDAGRTRRGARRGILDGALAHASPPACASKRCVAQFRLAANPTFLLKKTLQLSQDDDNRVRIPSALAIGGLSDAAVVPVLAGLAARDTDDRWMRTAVCCALPEHAGPLVLALLSDEKFLSKPAAADLLEQLASIIEQPKATQLPQCKLHKPAAAWRKTIKPLGCRSGKAWGNHETDGRGLTIY